MTLEEEMIDKAAKELMHDIDREVLWSMLENIGWYRVMVPHFESREQSVDIVVWAQEHCKKAFEHNSRDFIFESQTDANWFKLRWGTV